LHKAAHVLAPPTVTRASRRHTADIQANRAWLKAHWQDYAGQWIALRDGHFLAAAPSFEALAAQVDATPNVLMTKLPAWRLRFPPASRLPLAVRATSTVRPRPILAEAVVDTGGVYLFCNPEIARRLALTPTEALSGVQTILFRGALVHGRLYRLSLTLLADEGEDVTIQTTAFVPEPEEAEHWGDMPCLLGLYGCLERLRFAVDPRTEHFYFGPAAEAS